DTAGRGADLLVAIDRLCREAGVAPGELDAIAVGAGPGSFTGLRIGMATAKGIAFAANRPLWAVSSLAALADDAQRELATGQLDAEAGGLICAALDARRGEVFAGCFRGGVAVVDERVLAPHELAPWVAQIAGGLAMATAPGAANADAPGAANAAAPDEPSAHARVWFVGDALAAHGAALAALEGQWLSARTPSGRAVARLALAGARVDVTLGGA